MLIKLQHSHVTVLVPVMYLVTQHLMKIKLDEKDFIYMFYLETNKDFINSNERQLCAQLWMETNLNPVCTYI